MAVSGTRELMERLHRAMNRHDLDDFASCFEPGYVSQQPAHPDRAFVGRDQVRKNWGEIFSSMPDFSSEMLSFTVDEDRAWVEWRWTATEADGSAFDWRGVCLFGASERGVTWGRLYMEPVDLTGGGIDATIREMTGGGEA